MIFKNFDDFISTLNKKAGTLIDSNTYDYDILKSIFLMNESINESTESFLNSLDYENKTGTDLDKYLNFFNIYRKKGNNNDIYEFLFFYTGSIKLTLVENSIFMLDGFNYKIIKDTEILPGEKNILYANKTFVTGNFSNPIFSSNGVVKFDSSAFNYDEEVNLSEQIPKTLKFISIKQKYNDEENDLVFLERGKNIIQSMGFSNNKKIENELKKDSRIRGVNFTNQNGLTTITIFPVSYNMLDDAVAYAKEVVEFYKDSNIQVIRPNLIEINVSGIFSQIMNIADSGIIMNDIALAIKEYLSNALIQNSIRKGDILSLIVKTLQMYNATSSINLNLIFVNANLYWHENYNSPIITEEIIDSLDIGENNIITFGHVE